MRQARDTAGVGPALFAVCKLRQVDPGTGPGLGEGLRGGGRPPLKSSAGDQGHHVHENGPARRASAATREISDSLTPGISTVFTFTVSPA